MLTLTESATITGDIASIWDTVADVSSWPQWDPHVEQARYEGQLEPGTLGWTKPKGAPAGPFKVVAVTPRSTYSTESPMPGGVMRITGDFEELGGGHVLVSRRVELTGWFVPIFKLLWAKGMRRDMHHTFTALEQEAQRRAADLPAGSPVDLPDGPPA